MMCLPVGVNLFTPTIEKMIFLSSLMLVAVEAAKVVRKLQEKEPRLLSRTFRPEQLHELLGLRQFAHIRVAAFLLGGNQIL